MQLSEKKVACSAVLGKLSSALEGGWAVCSPEGLYLVLALEQVYRGKVSACSWVVRVDCGGCYHFLHILSPAGVVCWTEEITVG